MIKFKIPPPRKYLHKHRWQISTTQDFAVIPQSSDDLNNAKDKDSESCSVCRDLLTQMEKFFGMLQAARKSSASDWLTVDEIASELRISKSIVYRLVRNGDLEAVNIVDNNGRVAQKGHYRIRRSSLNKYLEIKKVKRISDKSRHNRHSRRRPNVKNYLGI